MEDESTVFRDDSQRPAVTVCRYKASMTIGSRIRARREELKITRKVLAGAMKIAISTLSDLELGRSASTTGLHHAAKRLGVRAEWLETGMGQKFPKEVDSDWRDVRGFAQAAGLGDGAEAEEYAVAHALKFRAQSLSRKRLQADKLCVFYGKGDSMLPRIQPGDAILFDTTDTRPRDGMIYIIMWKGEYYAKRAELLDDAVYFRTDNPNGDHGWHKPRRMDNARDPIQIVGRVRWIGSWED